MQEICIPLDVGLIGETITTGRAVNVADAYLHPKFNRAIDMRTGYRTKSVLCVPIVVKGEEKQINGLY
jgi:signal transduction protein with GAF and PtsI domain